MKLMLEFRILQTNTLPISFQLLGAHIANAELSRKINKRYFDCLGHGFAIDLRAVGLIACNRIPGNALGDSAACLYAGVPPRAAECAIVR